MPVDGVGSPVVRRFTFDREGHVDSGDPEFDKQMGGYVRDYFQSHPETSKSDAVRGKDAPPAQTPPAPLPDLVIPHIGSTPFTPHPGDAVVLDVTVLNGGFGDAGAFHVRVHTGGTYAAEEAVAGLKSFQGVTVCFPSKDPDDPNDPFQTSDTSADYWIIADADSQNEVVESNKTNNEESWLMTVM